MNKNKDCIKKDINLDKLYNGPIVDDKETLEDFIIDVLKAEEEENE